MGAWDSFKAGLLAPFGVDYYSKKSSQTLGEMQDDVRGRDHNQSAGSSSVLLKQAQRVLMVDWADAIKSNDMGLIQATIRRTLPVLDELSVSLESNQLELVQGLGLDAYLTFTGSINAYREAGNSWLAGDVQGARYWMKMATKKWEQVVDLFS